MKSYTLIFDKTGFSSYDSNLWRTPIIDLYDNNQYKNYSIRRSNYGSDLLGKGIYTGLQTISPFRSEIGRVDPESLTKGHIDLPGTAGNYVSIQDSNEFDLAGDLCIVARVALDDWTPAAEQTIFGKWNNSTNQRAYRLSVGTTGNLIFNYSTTGANAVTVAGGTPVGAADGSWVWVGVSFRADDGAGNRVTKFWTSTNGYDWTQLGSTLVQAGAVVLFQGSAMLSIGGHTTGTLTPFAGKVDYVSLRSGNGGSDGPNGAEVFGFDAADLIDTAATSFTTRTGHTATVNVSGSPATTITASTLNTAAKFIDMSGQIDIIAWSVDIQRKAGVDTSVAMPDIWPTLNIYNSDDPTSPMEYATPGSWANQQNIRTTSDIYMLNADRYAYFELDFDTGNLSHSDFATFLDNFDVTLYIRIEIASPVIDAFFSQTGAMMDQFPQWMAINEFNPQDPNFTQMASPASIGGQLLNALAGEWLNDIQAKIEYQRAQYYIDTVDINQKAWVFRSAMPDNAGFIARAIGDGVELAQANSVEEFHASVDSDQAYFWNKAANEVFTNKQYTTFTINGTVVTQELYHTWNCIDDLGETVDLRRHNGESNTSFRTRIKDTYINKPGTSVEAFKKAIRRELNLWQFENATPDSYYVGATPSVLEMSDIEKDPLYFTERGLPTQKFKDLVEELASKYPLTWGYFRYNQAYWDQDGLKREGFDYLPRQFDATPISEEYLDSGVGDGNDLFLFKPDFIAPQIDFTTRLKVRGRQYTTRDEYEPVRFRVAVYGRADKVIYTNPVFSAWFTIEVVVGGVTYFSPVKITTTSDVDENMATPSVNSYAYVDWVNAGATPASFTNAGQLFYNKTTGAIYANGNATPNNLIRLDAITSVAIRPGKWDWNTQTFTNVPTQANYKVWFQDTPGTVLGAGGASGNITKSPYNYATHDVTIVAQSQLTSSTNVVDGWTSVPYEYRITLNNGPTPTVKKNFKLKPPPIQFPASATNKEYIIEFLSSNDNTFGATGTEHTATPVFIPSSLIRVNDNGSWSGGNIKTFGTTITEWEFSTGTNSSYPVSVPNWTSFEALQTTPVSGVVDSNGPWRDGLIPSEGNTNYALKWMDLTRADFGLSNSATIILTWIGVDSISAGDVNVWLDSNTIKPRTSYPGETGLQYDYPDDAIVEYLDGGVYGFNPFPLYARARQDVNKKWNPKIHSGWFYDDVDEYYLYANPKTFSTTSKNILLNNVVIRQGAPITIYGTRNAEAATINHYDLRQVSNFLMDDEATPATPYYSLTHSEVVQGNGTNRLYLAYDDVYAMTAYNLTLNKSETLSSATSTSNIATFSAVTNPDYEYEVTYKVNKSYYVEQVYGATPSTRIVFDDTTYNTYHVTYESSIYNPATPIDVPLNPMHTSIDEGFIYIDHDVRPIKLIECHFSPSRIIADAVDYGLVTVKTIDDAGNPKPFVDVTLYTNFGTLSSTTVKTDQAGFAFVTLTSELWDGSLNPNSATPALAAPTAANGYKGQVLAVVTGDVAVNSLATFGIKLPEASASNHKLVASPVSDAILADGISAVGVRGKVLSSAKQPVPNAQVFWRKGRTVYQAFNQAATYVDNFFRFPGIAGNYLSTPDAAALDITGDITMVAKVAPDNWVPGVDMTFISKFNSTANQRSYRFGLMSTGLLRLVWSTNGTDTPSVNSTVSVQADTGIPNGQPLWVAVTLDVDNGASGNSVRFWTSTTGSNWTQLGTTVTTAGVTSIFSGSANINIGSHTDGVNLPFSGAVFAASIRNGIGASGTVGGATVFNLLGSNFTLTTNTTFSAQSGHTMTVNRSGSPSMQLVFGNYDATPGSAVAYGYTTTDPYGHFVIEPFISQATPGYWFVALESSGYMAASPYFEATPNAYSAIGDVVVWYEYPNVNAAADPITNMPVGTVQTDMDHWLLPNYTAGSAFPVNYDEENRQATGQATSIPWEPPKWYAIDKYRQYQMGLRGSGYYVVGATPPHPDYKEF
jgi:hypothetical protein